MQTSFPAAHRSHLYQPGKSSQEPSEALRGAGCVAQQIPSDRSQVREEPRPDRFSRSAGPEEPFGRSSGDKRTFRSMSGEQCLRRTPVDQSAVRFKSRAELEPFDCQRQVDIGQFVSRPFAKALQSRQDVRAVKAREERGSGNFRSQVARSGDQQPRVIEYPPPAPCA